jgi:hypothetical protein
MATPFDPTADFLRACSATPVIASQGDALAIELRADRS